MDTTAHMLDAFPRLLCVFVPQMMTCRRCLPLNLHLLSLQIWLFPDEAEEVLKKRPEDTGLSFKVPNEDEGSKALPDYLFYKFTVGLWWLHPTLR